MSISLGHNLNKTVGVSIPSLFGDDLARVCTLVGIEPSGVWLLCADPSFTFQTDQNQIPPTNPNVFIPFAQIAYLLDSTSMATPAGASSQPSSESSSPDPEAARPKRKK
jgi:hypothetical protein